MITDATADEARTVQFDEEDAQDEGSGEDVEDEYEEKAELLGEVDELSLQLGNDTDDEDQAAAQGERPPLILRATRNADMPMAMAQARWPVLGPELTQPVNSTDINQLVEDTVLLLKAMGFRCTSRPNSLLLGDWDPNYCETTPKTVEHPSRIPLPKTPERKRAEVFRSTEGTPYFEDSHMKTPTRGKQPSGRYAELFDAADAAELSDSDDGREYQNSADESVKDVIKHLSFDDTESDRTQYLEVRTHASLDKIPMFEGKRYRPDDSLQWLKRFIYEMKGTRLAQDLWYEPFSLKLERGAKSWYRQLPKKTQRKWSLLSEAFADYYCSQFDESARARYYSAQRKDNELVCDFLIRLNGYAKSAKIQYEAGGADAVDHVEHFLLHCGDDDVMDLLYPQQLADIKKAEKIINQKILGERRKKQRDRTQKLGGVSRAETTGETTAGNDVEMTAEMTDEADATMDDPYELAERRQSNRRSNLYDSDSDRSDGSQLSYSDSTVDSEDDYIDTGFTSDRDLEDTIGVTRLGGAVTPVNAHRMDLVLPAAFCKQLHDVGQCELFQRYEKLTAFVKSNVAKSELPEDLQDLYTPTEPAVEANFVFAFVGEAGRPKDQVEDEALDSDSDGLDCELGESGEESRARLCSAVVTQRSTEVVTATIVMKLLPGERLDWWSSQKFDRRVRMRSLVMGAVNDQRTKILLDTGANVSAVSEGFAKRLRLKRFTRQGQQIGVQGIGKGKVATMSRAMMKVTLGWEVTYEFEVWILDHHAGVELILGTDFMIPAGIRLDLYNSVVKLPDEVVLPLVKSQNSADEPKGGHYITDGPTEPVNLESRVPTEFRLMRNQPSDETHDFWVRRTKDWVPTVVLDRRNRVVRVRLTNLKPTWTWCPAHFPVVAWAPHGVLPPDGYVRLHSAKYKDWQVMAYEAAMDKDLLQKEHQLHVEWLARQPSAVDRRNYPEPRGKLAESKERAESEAVDSPPLTQTEPVNSATATPAPKEVMLSTEPTAATAIMFEFQRLVVEAGAAAAKAHVRLCWQCGQSCVAGSRHTTEAEAGIEPGWPAITQEVMIIYMTSIFKVMYETTDSTKTKMGVSPEELARATVEQCFKEADLNGDNKLSFEESKKWCTSGI
ncbi:hypothetical protein PHYSODRAFT_343274 [Phytophthora sojae]|uniref:Peptidase A2 domain-containing protein n=1 Tax=Phytophthora sojae (strain P6497) TaxID=1094619 RepID=G5A3R0_PHYSP|nr:hypothetical protein PHYSODRAFT_338891 [Phytophthora sojae]XP_009540121.1 hypothetical protein PHYSODRAFT_343274 [Phytophthora sojae]EGZ04430.1 hypothetical protein PHYSODRAFT_343274 [Phytophthora sojae]EGZ10224.1 hypothetical protein PHYSODRAFT_338891 [Phytophthora sojae]|eukprot:XP_009535085.1 hypothetical protein PHYSODRAFT_338891 [Phytophthora sojae]